MVYMSMTQFLTLLGLLAMVIVGVVFVFSQVRRDDLKTLRSSNGDLRDRLDDQEKAMAALQAEQTTMRAELDTVTANYKQLVDIVLIALDSYFVHNPDTAIMMQKRLRT